MILLNVLLTLIFVFVLEKNAIQPFLIILMDRDRNEMNEVHIFLIFTILFIELKIFFIYNMK